MKKLIAICFLGLMVRAASAQVVQIPLLGGQQLDISNFLQNLHPAYAYDQHGDNLGALSLPLISFNSVSGLPMADINGGFIFAQSDSKPVTAGGSGGVFAAVGLRFDSLMHLAGATSWFKAHVTAAPVPSIEVGPLGGYIKGIPRGGPWVYGAYVSMRI